jgi:Flp pilus assembly protein TadB
VKTVLKKAGIDARVVGEMLQAALGELPMGPATSPRVWVPRKDETRARAVIAEWEQQRSEDRTEERAPWACPRCGEEVEGSFDICWKCQAPRDPTAKPESDGANRPDPESDGGSPLDQVLREGGERPVRNFLFVSLFCTLALIFGARHWGFVGGAAAAVLVGVVSACWLGSARRGR